MTRIALPYSYQTPQSIRSVLHCELLSSQGQFLPRGGILSRSLYSDEKLIKICSFQLSIDYNIFNNISEHISYIFFSMDPILS